MNQLLYLLTGTCHLRNALLPVVLLVCLVACNSKTPEPKAAPEVHDTTAHEEQEVSVTAEQYKTAGITTGVISYRNLSGTIKVNGLLDVPPQQMISVSAPLGGFLQSSEMLQGKRVRKGEVIAIMQDPAYIQLQQDYLEYKSQQEYLQAEYQRQQELAVENVNAAKALQQAKANYESMQARLSGVKARLRLINVNFQQLDKGNIQNTIPLYAPISGFVTEVNMNIGKYANPADVLFEIVDPSHVHAELTVFEKDIAHIKIGQKVKFLLSNETKERTATVYLIGREIDKDRTVRIHCHLDNEDASLLPGMYLTAYVETSQAQQPALPNEAILYYEGRHYIFIRDAEAGNAGKQHFLLTAVETGVSENGYTAVHLPAALDAGKTQVVLKGAYDLLGILKNSEEEEHGH
jgi:cobalt-zinc-cadmium efflux system membrane fusion protein